MTEQKGKPRGRPSTGQAKTAAERMRAMRARQKADREVAHRWYGNSTTEQLCELITKQTGMIADDEEGVYRHVTPTEEAIGFLAWLEIGRRNRWL